MSKKESEILLISVSIGGYPAVPFSGGNAPAHARAIISILMKGFLQDSRGPLRLLSVSGGRAFMYAVSGSWKRDRERIKSRLSSSFINFRRAAMELTASSPCRCGACAAASHLRLKAVIHAGRAVMSGSGKKLELAGPDVELVRMLAGNSVKSSEYILMTAAAMRSLGYSDPSRFFLSSENYPGIGEIKTHILLPGPAINEALEGITPKSLNTPLNRIKTAGLLFEAMVKLSQ